MNPLWLVEKGTQLKGLCLNEPTRRGLQAHGMIDCTVRRSPVAPTQLTIGGAEEVFNLVGDKAGEPDPEHEYYEQQRQRRIRESEARISKLKGI